MRKKLSFLVSFNSSVSVKGNRFRFWYLWTKKQVTNITDTSRKPTIAMMMQPPIKLYCADLQFWITAIYPYRNIGTLTVIKLLTSMLVLFLNSYLLNLLYTITIAVTTPMTPRYINGDITLTPSVLSIPSSCSLTPMYSYPLSTCSSCIYANLCI